MKKSYILLIKAGEKKYMESLIHEGVVYCKTLQYFRDLEDDTKRKDRNDGSVYIKQSINVEVHVGDQIQAIAPTGQLYLWDRNRQGNIYCMFGIEAGIVNMNSTGRQNFGIDLSTLDLGHKVDTAVLIHNVGEFINRVRAAVIKKGYEFNVEPVSYYNHKNMEGALTPFMKSAVYQDQKEIRIWVPNQLSEDLKFEIGDMSDISNIYSIGAIKTLSYSLEPK